MTGGIARCIGVVLQQTIAYTLSQEGPDAGTAHDRIQAERFEVTERQEIFNEQVLSWRQKRPGLQKLLPQSGEGRVSLAYGVYHVADQGRDIRVGKFRERGVTAVALPCGDTGRGQ
jgi:hypothetical protein